VTTRIIRGDARAGCRLLRDESVHCIKTSPPYYGLRAYQCEETVWGGEPGCPHDWSAVVKPSANGVADGMVGDTKNEHAATRMPQSSSLCLLCGAWRGTLGLEPDWRDYLDHLVEVFRELRRVLRHDGVVFLNMGDSYASGAGKVGEHPGGGQGERWRGPMTQPNRMPQSGFKPKDRMLMPERLAIALQDDGWWVRDVIVWNKPNPMPSSVEDRTTPAHEMVYVLTKRAHYFWDGEAIKEPFADSSIPRMERAAARSEPEPGGLRADLFDASGAAVQNYRRPNEVLRDLSQKITRKPQGWDAGPGRHSTLSHNRKQNGSAKFAGHEDGESTWEGTGRNKRSVWTIATKPFGGEFCTACRTYFEGDELRGLRVEAIEHADGRKERRRHCSCARWDAWLSHFATFPTKLVEPCLLAACPERCCATCGRGWRRVTGEAVAVAGRGSGNKERVLSEERGVPGDKGHVAASVPSATPTLGWEPDCGCGAPAVPGVILDCFGGAGTVAVVAQRTNRDAILIELSDEYAEMARQRLVREQPLFACVEVEDVLGEADVEQTLHRVSAGEAEDGVRA
jgi:DNA modification methylase